MAMKILHTKHYFVILLLIWIIGAANAQIAPGGDIQAAIDAANPGDTITLAAGDHLGFKLNKAVTIQGPNVGTPGDCTRAPEARIFNATVNITADGAVLNGVEVFRDNADDTRGVLLQAAATIQNSVFRRDATATGTVVRAVEVAVGTADFTVSNNFFTGNDAGGYFSGHRTWNNCFYANIDPATIAATITNNTFDVCRSAMNFDGFSPNVAVNNNTFLRAGTHIAFGGVTSGTPAPPAGSYTLTGNNFDINFADPSSLPSAIINNSNVANTFVLDLQGNTFGGIPTGTLTPAQKVAVEARMFHKGRSGREGFVNVVTGEQVVVAGLTTVQAAIDKANPGDEITIFYDTTATPYTEAVTAPAGVNCGNAFTLTSVGAGDITLTSGDSFFELDPSSNITSAAACAVTPPPGGGGGSGGGGFGSGSSSVGGIAKPLFPEDNQ